MGSCCSTPDYHVPQYVPRYVPQPPVRHPQPASPVRRPPPAPRYVTRHEISLSALLATLECTFGANDGMALGVFNNKYLFIGSGNGGNDASDLVRVAMRKKPDGGTRLYDSICDAVRDFYKCGTGTRPWVLVVLTDGEDTCSRMTAQACGDYVRREFTQRHSMQDNPDNANYVFVVGVGLEPAGRRALQAMTNGRASPNFQVLTLDDFAHLQLCLLAISIKVTTGIQVDMAQLADTKGRQAIVARVQEVRSVSAAAVDLFFLMDISGSMGQNV